MTDQTPYSEPLCAVADCDRVAPNRVLVEGVNGHQLDELLPVWVCDPCLDHYGLVAENANQEPSS